MDLSPPPLNRSYSSSTPTSRPRGPRPAQPSTPSITPPTPVAGPSSARTLPSSLPSSYQDMAPDPEDAERQTNRRSMYRSPGTSSSPDLATLLRKARERGGVPVGLLHKQDKRRESPPPLPPPPDRPSMTTRPRSSTTYSPNPASPHTSALPKDESRSNHDDRISARTLTTQYQSRENGISKIPKASVRSKTSAFFGKVLGQGTVRERSKTDATGPSTSAPTYSSPSLLDAFTPPVPALPVEHQRSPTTSPIADVFTTTRAPNLQKVLPPIQGEPAMRDSDDSDERSMVFIDQAVLPNPLEPPLKPEETQNPVNVTKMRSVRDGDMDLKSTTSTITPQTPEIKRKNTEPQWEDTTFHGILNDFKGELSQLDPVINSSLDLRDPSTPSRRAAIRAQADNNILPSGLQDEQEDNETLYSTPSTPQSPGHDGESNSLQPSPIVPPRTTSLLTASGRSASGPALGRTTNIRSIVPPVKARSGPSPNLAIHSPRESNRLRMQHRSTASSSEPSLIPTGDHTHASLTTRTSSHQDLSVNDLARRPSSNNISEDEPADMDARGKELAARCWNEDEDFLAKEKIAEWLGGHGRINKIALRHYMDYFDFGGLRLDLAFRRLCAKLYLKGETQQVDRILETFSGRYWDCNPGGIYGSANIVHAVSYSLLLLNTDLHVAELQTRMSRNQFVRNTLTAVQMQLQPTPASPLSVSDLTYDDCSSIRGTIIDEPEIMTRSKRSDSITSWNSVSRDAVLSLTTQHNTLGIQLPNGSTPSIQISTAGQDSKAFLPQQGYSRAWENDMETLLKEMYSAIKSQQILQPLNTSFTRSSLSSLSPGGTLMRNRSLRVQPDRLATLKRGSIRGLQSILSAQSSASPYSSNSSIDGRVSPSPSFATSTHEAIYGSSSSFLTPTLGFASNLSHTIIREAQEDDDRSTHSDDSTSTTISISDEELALLGAPWAKEGMLCRKHYWEATGKRAKDKSWLDVFVVIQKGELNMFTFGDNGAAGSGTFGGGNWLANAHSVGVVHLSHALAHSLPPPGYNRQRPYCMVLTLSNGGVYFFQAGTEELVNEWVSTCNYWAARTSKEPLAGGVSNMEYGWNRVLDPSSEHAHAQPNEPVDQSDTVSVRSGRSSRSKFGWREGATIRGGQSPWADKTFINDWKPPLPPTVSSLHDEETQLEALRKHVKSMKLELESHNELRQPMAALYQPRTPGAMKAQSNWEKKSQHLLTEIVKYDSYIDSLQAAMSLRLKKRGEKALERALNGGNPPDGSPLGRWKGPDQATIREEVEPTTPGARSQFPSHTNGRETAEVSAKE